MRLPSSLSFPISILVLVAAAGASQAQEPERPVRLYDFEFTGPEGIVEVPFFPGPGNATFSFKDRSTDTPGNLVPGAPQTRVPLQHKMSFHAEPVSPNSDGWRIQGYTTDFVSYGDQPPQDVLLNVLAEAAATNPYFVVRMTATMETPDGPINKTQEVTFWASGLAGIAIRSPPPFVVAPHAIAHTSITVTNNAIFPQRVTLEPVQNANPCHLGFGVPGAIVLQPYGQEGSQQEMFLSVVGPSNGTYYQGDSCTLSFIAMSQDLGRGVDGGAVIHTPVTVLVRVEGLYIDPVWIFWSIAAAMLVALLVVVVRRAKERVDERLLQKPQKPWLIPVEQVYLAHLKRKDPRAWYVVRHYLMEDEYRSSLLWHKAYRAATKGVRRKERLILREEADYGKWQRKWRRRIAKPMASADAYEAKMRRKLARKERRALRKDRRKWRRLVEDLKAANAKALARAQERHDKAVAKARRKGRAEPEMPAVAMRDIPAEPQPRQLQLEGHRYGRKVKRYRARMARRQGNLEVRHERADARYQARLRARVQRLARKLDDPDFVAEHPMLQAGADAAPKGRAGGKRAKDAQG